MAEPRDLVLVTITGVQSYISQSRTTRDLAAASAILSDLTGRGARAVDGLASGLGRHRVVVPAEIEQPTGLPNRVLISSPAGTDLFRAPRATPAPVLPAPVPTSRPRHVRTGDRAPLGVGDRTGQLGLHVLPQPHIGSQLRWLRTLEGVKLSV